MASDVRVLEDIPEARVLTKSNQQKLPQAAASAICHSHSAHVRLARAHVAMVRSCTGRVPIYAASSWASIISLNAAFYLDPIRDIYEASSASSNISSTLTDADLNRPLPYIPSSSYSLIFLAANVP